MFDSRSEVILDQLHPDLRYVVRLASELSDVPFQLHEGSRTVDRQLMYYKDGKSQINPKSYEDLNDLCKVAKHVVNPEHKFYKWSRAVDFHVDVNGYKWDWLHLSHVGGVMLGLSRYLKARGKLMYEMRWGGDFNMNGIIQEKNTFLDGCHIELIY